MTYARIMRTGLTLFLVGSPCLAQTETAAEGATPAAESQALPLTREAAIAQALGHRPGEVIKAYRETKRGRDLWEVQIRDEEGRQWELYYAADDGTLVAEEIDD